VNGWESFNTKEKSEERFATGKWSVRLGGSQGRLTGTTPMYGSQGNLITRSAKAFENVLRKQSASKGETHGAELTGTRSGTRAKEKVFADREKTKGGKTTTTRRPGETWRKALGGLKEGKPGESETENILHLRVSFRIG